MPIVQNLQIHREALAVGYVKQKQRHVLVQHGAGVVSKE